MTDTIPGVPDGYRIKRIGTPKRDDVFLAENGKLRRAIQDYIDGLPAVIVEPDPDPLPEAGEGYRLIDQTKDKPENGDEFWCKVDKVWKRRILRADDFVSSYTYRRRIEKKYRAFQSYDEAKHVIGLKVVKPNTTRLITGVEIGCVIVGSTRWTFQEIFESEYRLANGSPVGVEVKE